MLFQRTFLIIGLISIGMSSTMFAAQTAQKTLVIRKFLYDTLVAEHNVSLSRTTLETITAHIDAVNWTITEADANPSNGPYVLAWALTPNPDGRSWESAAQIMITHPTERGTPAMNVREIIINALKKAKQSHAH